MGEDCDRARALAQRFVHSLAQLISWFERQSYLCFYASSLLLAYDGWTNSVSGLLSRCQPNIACQSKSDAVVVRLIDFTRWRPLDVSTLRRDENFLHGLYRLHDLFERAATTV